MPKPKILIIDDELDMQETLKSILKKRYMPETASSGDEGLKLIEEISFDAIFLDIRMPKMDGIETLKKIKEIDKTVPIIMLTASRDVKSAVECIKLSAENYLNKPFDVEELLTVLEKSLQKREMAKENQYLKETLKETSDFGSLIGENAEMKRIKEFISIIASTESTILISGESGTGKEVVARTIHALSNRKNKPFIAINCAAIPENLLESELFGYERGAFTGAMERKIGKFEMADLGTIFLDEIGCMPPAMQSKLLRVLEEKKFERLGGTSQIEVDIRIIAATNIDFETHITEGKFREDLYYRINVLPIKMPPLRERKDDLNLFISFFINKFNKEIKGVSQAGITKLHAYDFPGNIRELQNIIERAAVLSTSQYIEEDHLFGLKNDSAQKHKLTGNLKKDCEAYEKILIINALKEFHGNKSKAAEKLGIARTTLTSKVSSMDIK